MGGTLWAGELPTMSLTYYRGPGGLDRSLGRLVCDADPETEWRASGLSKTVLGPPFEFVFEFVDGSTREIAGLRILSAGEVSSHRLKGFEVRVRSEEGAGFDRVIYTGEQSEEAETQTHLFEQPIRVRQFMVKYLTNRGDADHAQLNEIWPVFDAGETTVARLSVMSDGIPFVEPEQPDESDREHLPFRVLEVPEVPVVEQNRDVYGPLDAFVLKRLEESGLGFAEPAARDVWLRRVTYDLTGLPPSASEIDAFVNDHSAEAYEKVVERLLESSAFGERWAQHWLDVVRYADTNGFAANGRRKDAWRYRDYVVESFNEDRPYDRFVKEQLAADEMEPFEPERLPALGFTRMGPFRTNSGNQNLERNRQELLTEMTGSVGTTFLGLTIGCARCHDHKIDPVLQTDYYRLQAYFAAVQPVNLAMVSRAEEAEWQATTAKIQGAITEAEREKQKALDRVRERYLAELMGVLDEPTRVAIETPVEERTEQQVVLASSVEPRLSPKEKELLAACSLEEKEAITQRVREIKKLRGELPAALPQAWALRDMGEFAPTTYVLHRGEYQKKTARVGPQVPSVLPQAALSQQPIKVGERKTTGRRLALANWLTAQGGESQVARVMVNRLWQHLFGRGIVATPNDFGFMGEEPTHPELLEWLANDFIEHDWKMKRMIRQMVLSRTYRQRSEVTPEMREKDELNELFSRYHRRRLSAEEVRDSLLVFTESLNRKAGGPGVTLPQPEEVLANIKNVWIVTKDEAEHDRRSLYLFVERKLRVPLLETFDQPDTLTTCAVRPQSTHALQALTLVNNEWVNGRARLMGAMLERLEVGETEKIESAYQRVTGRRPGEQELAGLKEFMTTQRALPEGEGDRSAWADLALVMFNLNRFLYLD